MRILHQRLEKNFFNKVKLFLFLIFIFYKMDAQTADRIIEMAWEDRTSFEAINLQFGFSEKQVIVLMRQQLKRSSFKLWRRRVNSGHSSKHLKKRSSQIDRFKCTRQKTIANNKITKR